LSDCMKTEILQTRRLKLVFSLFMIFNY